MPIAIFVLNLFVTFIFDAQNWIWSVALHFSGGVSMALIFFNFFENNQNLYSFKKQHALNLIFAVSFVALIGVLWEFLEWGGNFLFPQVAFQPSLDDTIADLFFDISGALVLAAVYFNSKLYKEPPLSK